jgi:hypothetical protein
LFEAPYFFEIPVIEDEGDLEFIGKTFVVVVH